MSRPLNLALRLEPRLVRRVWGGRRLATQLGDTGDDPIGEIWCAGNDNPATDREGRTRPLGAWIEADPPRMLGERLCEACGPELPILVKLIDTREAPSVQVHPTDEYARRVESASGYRGKTESWLVLDATPGAHVLHGIRAGSADVVTAAFGAADILDLLERVPVRRGTVVDVPAGTIHTIGPGIVLFEVQQRSDLTYRIFDFDRGREMHLERARDVSALKPAAPGLVRHLDLDHLSHAVVTDLPQYRCDVQRNPTVERWRNERGGCQILVRLDTSDTEPVGTTFFVPPDGAVERSPGLWGIAMPYPGACGDVAARAGSERRKEQP